MSFNSAQLNQIRGAYRRLNHYLKSEGIDCFSMTKIEKFNHYCKLTGIAPTVKKEIDAFLLKEYNTHGTKIFSGIVLPVKPRKAKNKAANKAKAEERKQIYIDYINSSTWKAFRKSIIDARGHKCETCGQTKGTIHAHHLTYVRFGKELPEDIKLLCVPCHEEVHGKKIGSGIKVKKTKTTPKPKSKILKPEDTHRWYELSTTVVEIDGSFLGIRHITNLFSESSSHSDIGHTISFMEMKEVMVKSYEPA